MSEEITIRLDEDHSNHAYRLTASVANSTLQVYKLPLVQSIIEKLRDRIVDMWLEQHGSELIEELSPGLLKKLVADSIAKKVLG